MVQVKDCEVVDTLKKSGFKIIQDRKRFCFGIDAVILADYAEIRNNDVVYDLGTGTGIIPMLLVGRSSTVKITALEVQQESADMAERSVAMNGLESVINVVHGDIKNTSELFPKAQADVVTCNPPYMIFQHGKQNPSDCKAIARHEVLCTLEDVVKSASYLLKPKGRFYMIHRPFRLAEIFRVMAAYNLEPKRMRLVQPFVDKEPNMVLLEARKGANSRITVEKPLVVYKTPGDYTDEIKSIYEIC